MKKLTVIIVFCILVSCFLGLCGCSAGAKELTVYYLDTGAQKAQLSYMGDYITFFDKAVAAFQKAYPGEKLNVVRFEDPDEMAERISIETATGKGPDVFLFNAESKVDVLKMAQNGKFEDLTSYFTNDDSFLRESYYGPILDACRGQNAQYLVPLGFDIPYLITTEEKLQEKGIAADSLAAYEGILGAIKADIAATRDLESGTFSNQDTRFISNLYYWQLLSGEDFVDLESGTVLLDKEDFRSTAETVLDISGQQENMKHILQTYSRNLAEVMKRITFMTDDENILFRTWFYQNAFEKTMSRQLRIVTVPSQQGPSPVAIVTEIAAVNANSGNKEKAYSFVRVAMDTEQPMYSYELSVRKEYNEKLAETISAPSAATYSLGSQTFNLDPVQDMCVAPALDALENMTTVMLLNPKVAEIVKESTKEYLAGTSTYDAMFDNLTNRLGLYLSE